ERPEDAETEPESRADRVHEEEGRDERERPGVAAVAAGERPSADGAAQPRSLVVEARGREDREPRGGELGALEERHAGGIPVDGARVLGRRRLAGVRRSE